MAIKRIVVDTSVMVKWVNIQDELYIKQADALLKDAQKSTIELFVPELAKYELGNAIAYKHMDMPLAQEVLATIHLLPITYMPLTTDLAQKTLEIALQYSMTYYDTVFISLAQELGAMLVTDNVKHQRRVPGMNVVALRDYK